MGAFTEAKKALFEMPTDKFKRKEITANQTQQTNSKRLAVASFVLISPDSVSLPSAFDGKIM